MKQLIFLFMLVHAAVVGANFVDQLPNGHFIGEGYWFDNHGQEGTYQSYVELYNNTMRIDYSFRNGTITESMSFYFKKAGEFDVFRAGDVVGHGSCHENQCSYYLSDDEVNFSETFAFLISDGELISLSKTGEKKINGREISWRENLLYVDIDDPSLILP